MPSNHTPNYALNQWERDDRVLMEDFNADNAKIDAALAAQAEAHAALAARAGNCSIGVLTYQGNGTAGANNPTRIAFPKMPAAYIVAGSALLVGTGGSRLACLSYNVGGYGHTSPVDVSWSGNTLSLFSSDAHRQLNENRTYVVIAFYAVE